MSLAGIGTVLSARIVFRGGFTSVDQLYMVYGLDSSVVDMHRPSLHMAPGSLRPMCLDTLSFRTLVRHPLFDADQTHRVLGAWGRGNVDVATFWTRLQPSAEEGSMDALPDHLRG